MKGAPAAKPRHASIAAALRAAVGAPGGITFVDLQERETLMTWRELHERALRVAAGLVARGVAPGDRVALVLATGPAFLDAFFGVSLAGAIPVPLSPPLRLGRLDEFHDSTARMMTAVSVRLVLTDARVRRLLGVAASRARPPLGCLLVDEVADAAPPPARSRETTSAPSSATTSARVTSLEPASADIGLIQFSSGSTVDPKPVALTQANLMAQVATIEQMVPSLDGSRQVGVSWLPLHHDMGLIGCLLSAIYRPDPLVLIPPELFLARPALWLRAISRHRATVSPAPSFAYSLCTTRIADDELRGVDLSSWQFALNGAEPVSVGVLDEFATRFAPYGFDARSLVPVYGLAEASLAVTFAPRGRRPRSLAVDPAQLAKRGRAVEQSRGGRLIASVGVPVPGVEVVLRDPDGDGDEVGEGALGDIWVRGPSVMRGYFDAPAATKRVLRDGWLATGDRGFFADGELYVCGRAKDIVIIRGANHAPQEFEECLDRVAGVRHGCAVALGFQPDGGEEQLLVLAERASGSAGPTVVSA
ncbi:MAG TPA: AMP-binding protein, partial [Polyangia bacterium]|nr:AMP-binding protein [Polyangia bacterium]